MPNTIATTHQPLLWSLTCGVCGGRLLLLGTHEQLLVLSEGWTMQHGVAYCPNHSAATEKE
jgi:hypothetical protein